jgi:hypothetical protein
MHHTLGMGFEWPPAGPYPILFLPLPPTFFPPQVFSPASLTSVSPAPTLSSSFHSALSGPFSHIFPSSQSGLSAPFSRRIPLIPLYNNFPHQAGLPARAQLAPSCLPCSGEHPPPAISSGELLLLRYVRYAYIENIYSTWQFSNCTLASNNTHAICYVISNFVLNIEEIECFSVWLLF